MKTVTIHQAKSQLSKLIQDVVNGEEVIIAKGSRPMVKLVIVEPEQTNRQIGSLKGKIQLADDFDDELDDFKDYTR